MTAENEHLETSDLILNVAQDFDPQQIRLDLYDAFLDALCQDREYQKEAIHTVCRLLAGGQYESTSQLARRNCNQRSQLISAYGSIDAMIDLLPFPDKLSCSVDLATGTGKSYVMYGVARILLAEGVVDRVLVLCPSLTIEAGLTDKFTRLSADATLLDLMPDDAHCPVPEIVNAESTTVQGQICIENIDATYSHVRSSVRDSFAGKGANTLVLNDESHHVLTPPTGERAIRRWKEFLNSPEYGFTRVVGFSGTCYVGDRYFSDVVYRYSLRSAIEQSVVKSVQYVERDESATELERFQKYLQLHEENRMRYRPLKPLSIVVAGRVDAADALARDFVRFLAERSGADPDDVARTVLVVTSDRAHKNNVARLRYVDRQDDPVEWVFSVSMLTEGWDVKNVFQIIPHERRAFNSKLLIAQVLGRGLRIPPGVMKPIVSVFNHSSWAKEIRGLVDEVLELDRRLHSHVVHEGSRSNYHIDLHQMFYKTEAVEQDLPLKNGNGEVQLFTRGYINYQTQPPSLQRQTVFADLVTGGERLLRTTVEQAAYSVEQVVERVRRRLKSVDMEAGTGYAKKYSAAALREIIEASLKRIGESRGLVSEANLQHTLRALGNTQRKMARTLRVRLSPDQIESVSTRTMRARSFALTNFRKEATVFYDSESFSASGDVDAEVLKSLAEEDSVYPHRAAMEVRNRYWWKTPVNVVLTFHNPERQFVRRLFDPEISALIHAWVKCPDVGFYEIAYSWRKADHSKQGKFNPDFFVELEREGRVLVIELKDDDDETPENRAKLKYSVEHFDLINEALGCERYVVKFISPEDYDGFFQAIRDEQGHDFVSHLQASLHE
ncbi:MAG: DEAD/DEAH box helicase [Mycobacterium sp.]